MHGILDALGEVLLQDNFTIWDPKQLIKKGRERRLFLFDMCLLVSKEVKDSNGKSKYMYKFKLMVSSCVLAECCALEQERLSLSAELMYVLSLIHI